MSDKVKCATHGESQATYVCQHIMHSLDTGKAVGFHYPADSGGLERPDAWCWECNEVCRSEGGEWTDKALEFVQVTVLCGGCYDRAKAIWLKARAS
jgi:hypothetical protein